MAHIADVPEAGNEPIRNAMALALALGALLDLAVAALLDLDMKVTAVLLAAQSLPAGFAAAYARAKVWGPKSADSFIEGHKALDEIVKRS